jgi:hypothetical protein
MDHQFGRLMKSIKQPDDKPHVQLVTSGGAEIQAWAVCTVTDGLVFNVDMKHEKAQKGGVIIAAKGVSTTLTHDASAHYDTGKPAGNGTVTLYEPALIAY